MRYLFATIISLWLLSTVLGCSSKPEQKSESSDSITVKKPNHTEKETYNLFFLGHYIRCSEESVYSEMKHLYANDSDVLFDKETGNIDICGTLFHVNHNRGGLVLMSSVQPDTRGIKQVRKYISKFHGEENYEEPDHYSWLPYTDSTKIGQNYPVIHLRRVHSEEGGTVIIVN